MNEDTLDSALLVKGPRNDNPTKEGIRLGYSLNVGSGRSYGIELCSPYTSISTIDFSYPSLSSSYFAGRMLFDNSQGIFGWNVRTTLASSELNVGDFQMYLNSNGELLVQSKIYAPNIFLNNINLQTTLDSKAPLNNPTFTGTVNGISKAMVGLGNVDNTTDLLKPISTATQTALNLKANLASPTFTGTVGGITKAMVGLSNVDDTSDANIQYQH